jgi:hypothetical protein
VCHDPQTVARRHFVVTPYEPDGDQFLPQLPDTCPVEARDGQPCRLFQDHFRKRKSGPAFALCVMRCRIHAIGFTLGVLRCSRCCERNAYQARIWLSVSDGVSPKARR